MIESNLKFSQINENIRGRKKACFKRKKKYNKIKDRKDEVYNE